MGTNESTTEDDVEIVVLPETVACQICLKEIPKMATDSAEVVEYVYYFCGPECFAEWQRGTKPPADEDGNSK